MKTLIKIEKEDIVTSRMGYNIEVQIDAKQSLIFTTEALDELIKDYTEIKKEIVSDGERIVEALRTARDISQLELNFDEAGN